MKNIDSLFERLNNSPLYISIKENESKKHTPYNFTDGYTNLLNASRFKLDQFDRLKTNIVNCVDNAKGCYSMQITDIQTKKVLFTYSNN